MSATSIFDATELAKIRKAARRARVEFDAACNSIFLAIAKHDCDPATGRPLTQQQRDAREKNLVGWAVWRAAATGERVRAWGTRDPNGNVREEYAEAFDVARAWGRVRASRERRAAAVAVRQQAGGGRHTPGWRARKRALEAQRAAKRRGAR